jgi:HlyD family secretion protein
VALGFRYGGVLAELGVSEGQAVQAGQELASLDQTDLELAVRAAEAQLSAQQAQLAQAQATPTPSDLAAAEAQLEAAKAALHRLETQPLPRDLEEARLQVEVAKDTLWATQLEGEVPGLPAASQQAVRARAAAAEQQVLIAELQYDRLEAGAMEADLASARAAIAQAQAALDRLRRGASTEELDTLRAAVSGSEVSLEQARWQLSQARLTAPFAGTIVEIASRAGEFVAPGTPIITLGDLSTLRVETTDLGESELGRVRVAQAAELTFDALPGEVLHGHVTRIADMASSAQGGTSFLVIIELDKPETRLRWGMSAFADIQAE